MPDRIAAGLMSMPKYRFARLLRKLRAERGWSQDRLAREADVTLAVIRRLERLTGKPAGPSWESARRLAVAFGITLDELAEKG